MRSIHLKNLEGSICLRIPGPSNYPYREITHSIILGCNNLDFLEGPGVFVFSPVGLKGIDFATRQKCSHFLQGAKKKEPLSSVFFFSAPALHICKATDMIL